jgi:serine/threonine protein kinase
MAQHPSRLPEVGQPLSSDPRADVSRLGKYQLLRRLATGGMAEIYIARAEGMAGFEKLVVLKRILPQHAESEDFIRMFLTEARLAATLHHPNIVQVYDIGEDAGTYFFTMEWVKGQDLRKLVRASRKAERALPLEHIMLVVTGVAAGLEHAHEQTDPEGRPLGIVHRDVSPSNVIVTYDGAVKLVDFGIAKAASAQSATVAGTLKGKIPYMSPEQCRGEQVDRRSDVFSIGTLLWELTTGMRLFSGDNEIAVLNRVARGDVPPPSTVRPDYPAGLEDIVMKALRSDPNQRYQTAMDLQIELEDFARETRLPVSSARLSKFMRELFSDELAHLAAWRAADRVDPSASLSHHSTISGNERTVIDGNDPPSDQRSATPQSMSSSMHSHPGGITVSGSESGVHRRPRRWPWAVAATGLFAVGGLAAVMTTGLLDEYRFPTDNASTAPTEPVVTLSAEVEVEPERGPTPVAEPAPIVDPGKAAAAVPSKPAGPEPPTEAETGDVEADDGADVEPAPAEVPAASDPVTPAPTPASKPSWKRKSSSKSKPSTDRKPTSPSSSTPDSGKKPKWDPDNPLPPS